MKMNLDKSLLLAVLFLLGLGLVQVYSSSYIFAIESYGDGLYFFRKQLLVGLLGIVLLLGLASMPWKYAKWIGYAMWAVAILGLVATMIPSLTIKAGGASRWVRLPMGQRFEPAELLKVTYPFIFALFVTKSKEWPNYARWPLALLAIGLPLALLLQQPDFGSFVICLMVALSVLFVFGLKWRYILASVAVTVPGFYFLVVQVPYRYARIKAFLDPWSDPTDRGFQVIQSMLSFHSGGVWGNGLGQGQGKLFFLPEAHTDFTLAVFGEEMGFVGFVFVMMVYGFLVFRGLQVAAKSKEDFNRATAVGVTTVFGLSVVINVGVVMGLLPTKGLTLPFMSYGGSSLICTCLVFGWLLNLEKESRLVKQKLRRNPYKSKFIPIK